LVLMPMIATASPKTGIKSVAVPGNWVGKASSQHEAQTEKRLREREEETQYTAGVGQIDFKNEERTFIKGASTFFRDGENCVRTQRENFGGPRKDSKGTGEQTCVCYTSSIARKGKERRKPVRKQERR